MSILSVDIASRGYRDFGFALLEPSADRPVFPDPSELGLEGRPQAESCAAALEAYCREQDVAVLLLDGPQGWRYPRSPIEHMRLCERVLNTPGRTGTPGNVKPAGYLGYITLSIALFGHLRRDHGWQLLEQDWHRAVQKRWVVESFPTSAWRLLGSRSLPGKAKARQSGLHHWRRHLMDMTGWDLPRGLTHDQLQAAVALTAGVGLAQKEPERVILSGVDPFLDEDWTVYEGLIANPSLAG